MDRHRLWLDLENTAYICEKLGFPGCQIALRVDRDVIANDGTIRLSETRYFLTSAGSSGRESKAPVLVLMRRTSPAEYFSGRLALVPVPPLLARQIDTGQEQRQLIG